MKDKNWKLRKDALDAVDQIIADAGKRISPNTGELLPALKVCLSSVSQIDLSF